MFNSLNVSASALTAQRLRMDVVSSNIANASSTRGKLVDGKWEPYRRKMVEMAPREKSFNQVLQGEMQKQTQGAQGVRVTGIVGDQTPFKTVYDPTHPDANAEGYVNMPNVDISKEMVDLLATSRAYEANITSFNTGKSIMLKALEIGR
ncbi:flagellar basal body rod protein FlgC [Neobacillus sp. MM2021_6]|uniref:flagellar basal body rod protein FlgC n=1 Tax=Bacillaceae TaxID=186817 RepID=UPI00140D5B98|nr:MULTISPECIES: flagellar basal body rod protein FlgC [Bacillaceae]MBO0961060.1 flagellar basal body rod protein FlgC [Neobacillus sp. MM2021_6]NHC20654.1 flagellar basal body rod protein FlgC [Bacillus sp. MM2020_4]WML39387.1 flagellar basal body rod protein FlgC [Neobacillus sp. OS1-2]